MKILPEKIILIALALVVAFAPVEFAFASVSDCMTRHHQSSNMADPSGHMTMANHHQQNKSKHACPDNHCNNGGCTTGHCAGTPIMAVPVTTNFNIAYTTMELVHATSTETFPEHPATLYRPPRSTIS